MEKSSKCSKLWNDMVDHQSPNPKIAISGVPLILIWDKHVSY